MQNDEPGRAVGDSKVDAPAGLDLQISFTYFLIPLETFQVVYSLFFTVWQDKFGDRTISYIHIWKKGIFFLDYIWILILLSIFGQWYPASACCRTD